MLSPNCIEVESCRMALHWKMFRVVKFMRKCGVQHAECYHKINYESMGTEIQGGVNEYEQREYQQQTSKW